jgi:hypothetical protein
LKPQSAEMVVRLMVAKDPRRSADSILEFLMSVSAAQAGAIFTVDSAPTLFVGRGIAQEALDWTAVCWGQEGKRLKEGRLSRSDGRLLLPVLRRDRLMALVYLEADQVDLQSLSAVSGLLGDAVVRGLRQNISPSAVETYLEQTPTEEIERRRLVILLDRHEWNVARVARELHLTRTTIYKRLTTFGIARKHVPKRTGRLRSPQPRPVDV